jgi:hypothetical protein
MVKKSEVLRQGYVSSSSVKEPEAVSELRAGPINDFGKAYHTPRRGLSWKSRWPRYRRHAVLLIIKLFAIAT